MWKVTRDEWDYIRIAEDRIEWDCVVKWMVRLFSTGWEQGVVPKDWEEECIVP